MSFTVEWHDAETDPPKEWGDYLIWRGSSFDVATYYPDPGDTWSRWQAMGHKVGGDFKLWAKLPEKPE